MPHIVPLDQQVAELIAAGEVVERPASVVKELVENAMDAGASAVAVEIRRGGMELIRVSDDGCGIAPEELPTAFLRHATSKVRTQEDLGRIGTLGFRGEALAAVCAVSRVEIRTCQHGASSGASLSLEGGQAGTVEEIGTPDGTVIEVRNLFYNTPARLKFMRKDSAESATIGGLIQHLALSRPEISFRFRRDDTDALHTPGDGKLLSAIYAAQGREFAATLIPAEGRGGAVDVAGYVTLPAHGRGSRSMQTFFVNGRFVKSQLLTAALEEAYRNQLLKGKFPGCVLSVRLPVEEVDVNVHPAKTQVKFARERAVFDAVYHTVLDTLTARGGVVSFSGVGAHISDSGIPGGEIHRTDNGIPSGANDVTGGAEIAAGSPSPLSALSSDSTRLTAPARQDFFRSMDAEMWRNRQSSTGHRGAGAGRGGSGVGRETGYGGSGGNAPAGRGGSRSNAPARCGVSRKMNHSGEKTDQTSSPSHLPDTERLHQEPMDKLTETASPADPAEDALREPVPDTGKRETGAEPVQQSLPLEEAGEPPWRIAGELLRTYIVCESKEGNIYLIDKHAAHERMNFDRLQSRRENPMRQTLLTPEAVELDGEDTDLLLENLSLLEDMGFGAEDFGGGTILVREIPAGMDMGDLASTLEELASDLRTGHSPEERREKALRTVACKAAIKGGWESGEAELRILADKVQSGEIRYCPHGRPIAVKLTKYQLEKLFKRA